MCLYVVTRFLICVYLDVFNKMFYFKLCKFRYRGKPILYIPGFKNATLLPYCIPEKRRRITTCNTLVEIYSHCKGKCLTLSSAKDHEYIHTKLQIQGHGSEGGIMLLEIIQAHDFLHFFVLISQSEDLYV